ncbi:MAG: hypothetical protein D6746_08555 [Bacteroidetes bacterium]|nr:MAG: hypothetical protein D6746_08555 [Bacteroidota bacterium]
MEIDGPGGSGRLNNASLIVSGTETQAFIGFDYIPKTDTGSAAEFLWRFGVSGSPPIGFKRDSTNQHRFSFDTSLGTRGKTFSLTPGTRYRIIMAWNNAGLTAGNWPNAGGAYLAIAVYDQSTSSPVAAFTYDSGANLAGTLDADTGFEFRSTSGLYKYGISHFFIHWGEGSESIADLFGQRQRLPHRLGLTLAHYWQLNYRADAPISSSPTGDEARALQDLGVGDGTSTRDLTTAVTPPNWVSTSIPRALTEDPVLTYDFTSPRMKNGSLLRTSMDKASRGVMRVKQGDSFVGLGLSGGTRTGGQDIEAMIDAGYEIVGMQGYGRTGSSNTAAVGVVQASGTANLVYEWFCNGSHGTGGYGTNPSGSMNVNDRYGVSCGGIIRVRANGVPTLGANNSILTFHIDSTYITRQRFTASDVLKFLPLVFYSNNTDTYTPNTGRVRFVTSAQTYDLDLSSSTAFRKFPQDGASWKQILNDAAGGPPANNAINAAKDYVSLGTGSTSYTIEVRLPDGLANGEYVAVVVPPWYKVNPDGSFKLGPKRVVVVNDADNSRGWDDLKDSAVSGSDTDKHRTDDQLGRYLSLFVVDPGMDIVYDVDVNNEARSETNAKSNMSDWLTRMESVTASLGMSQMSHTRYGIYCQFMHQVNKDAVHKDRQHLIDYANAAESLADDNPLKLWTYNRFRATKGYLGCSMEKAYVFTEMGLGESIEAAADTDIAGITGGVGDWLDSGPMHLADATVAFGMQSDVYTQAATFPYLLEGRHRLRGRGR